MNWTSKLFALLFGTRTEQERTFREIVTRMDAARDSYAEKLIEEGRRDVQLGQRMQAADVIARGKEKIRTGQGLKEGEAGLMHALGLDTRVLLNGDGPKKTDGDGRVE